MPFLAFENLQMSHLLIYEILNCSDKPRVDICNKICRHTIDSSTLSQRNSNAVPKTLCLTSSLVAPPRLRFPSSATVTDILNKQAGFKIEKRITCLYHSGNFLEISLGKNDSIGHSLILNNLSVILAWQNSFNKPSY